MNGNERAAIAEIHEQDVAEVRALLQQAIRAAGERWLPMNAIADAMMIELVLLRGRAPCTLMDVPRSNGSHAKN
jgi:hypothetical protein